MSFFVTALRISRPADKLSLTVACCILSWLPLSAAPPESHGADQAPKARPTPAAMAILDWTTVDGAVLNASYENLDEQDRVVLRLESGAVLSVPFASLMPPSKQQAKEFNKGALLSVLVLGDSMSLEGFGKRLDKKLREHPRVGAVNTYMACGTHPLSWLKSKPYSTIKTFCGYWSIETVPGSLKPHEVDESGNYGSKRIGHLVPKLETLIESLKPDVLILQSGNNFFSLFTDNKTINEDYHTKQIKFYVSPFMTYLATQPTSLKKLYWVTPPQTGKVTEDIQSFVFDQIRGNTRSLATLIDSRTVTHYPYKKMSADKEHFEGADALAWAEDVFALIAKDLSDKPPAPAQKLHEKALAMGGWDPPQTKEAAPASALKVRATLLAKTPAPAPEKFAPYKECLVAYQYQIDQVLEGKCDQHRLLVMHPAYIRLEKQPLDKLQIGKTYTLQLRELDKTSLWGTIRREDASDSFDLTPYYLAGDEQRHPDAQPQLAGHKASPGQGVHP